MLKKIFDIIERSEDEPIEFDIRYNDNTKKKIQKRREHYKDLMLFKSKKYNSDMGQPCLHAPNCRNWDSDDCIEWIVKED